MGGAWADLYGEVEHGQHSGNRDHPWGPSNCLYDKTENTCTCFGLHTVINVSREAADVDIVNYSVSLFIVGIYNNLW